jgi:O-methyltransferase
MECGVARGGVAAILGVEAQRSSLKRDLWLFDSFQGLPEPSALDGSDAAHYANGHAGGRLVGIGKIVASREEVETLLFEKMGLAKERVHITQGWFQNTLTTYPGDSIALLHLDADWYESVKVALDALWPYVSHGGYVVVDDYGDWVGARRAVREFLEKHEDWTSFHRKGVTQAYFSKEMPEVARHQNRN